MIQYFSGDVYKCEDVDVIFNPVGVRDNEFGFIKRVKRLYPTVYEMYNEKVWMYSVRELMGDIQLVYVDNNRFLLNAFCKDRNGNVNKLAFTKTLIELCNLTHEYHLTIGIEYALGVENKSERKLISTVIKEVFRDVDDITVKVFDRNKK